MPAQHPEIAAALGVVASALPPDLLHDGGRVVVGVSGGADSMVLCRLLALLRRRVGLDVSAAVVDHGLREASADEAEFAARTVRAWEVPARVHALALPTGSGLAQRARDARYAALWGQCAAEGASALALAHTATDQVETMLLHGARGAGLRGLAGMTAVAARPQGRLLRPLLALTRHQARALAARLEVPFVDDPTNRDRSHPRVRFRELVLPELCVHNPRAVEALADASRDIREAEEALRQWALETLHERSHTDESGWVIPWQALRDVPMAVRTRVIRSLCEDAGADEAFLGRDLVRAIATACDGPESPKPRTWNLRPRLLAELSRAGLRVGPGRAN